AVFAGLMLVHGHVAQPLFVAALGTCAFVALWRHRYHAAGIRNARGELGKPLLMCALLIAIFSFPIVLDVVLHKDNNVRAIIHHTVLHPGLQQSLMQSLKYACSFVAFVPEPEVVLKNPSARLLAGGASKPYVLIYWCICLTLAALAFFIWLKK